MGFNWGLLSNQPHISSEYKYMKDTSTTFKSILNDVKT